MASHGAFTSQAASPAAAQCGAGPGLLGGCWEVPPRWRQLLRQWAEQVSPRPRRLQSTGISFRPRAHSAPTRRPRARGHRLSRLTYIPSSLFPPPLPPPAPPSQILVHRRLYRVLLLCGDSAGRRNTVRIGMRRARTPLHPSARVFARPVAHFCVPSTGQRPDRTAHVVR